MFFAYMVKKVLVFPQCWRSLPGSMVVTVWAISTMVLTLCWWMRMWWSIALWNNSTGMPTGQMNSSILGMQRKPTLQHYGHQFIGKSNVQISHCTSSLMVLIMFHQKRSRVSNGFWRRCFGTMGASFFQARKKISRISYLLAPSWVSVNTR